MKVVAAGLLWLASTTGAFAYYPLDIENHARWAVLDGLPLLASGRLVSAEVTNLRTNDLATEPVLISAVCGTLDFNNTDDGVLDFVHFYSIDDDGSPVTVGRPFLYGRLSERNFDPQYEAALRVCGDPAGDTAVVAATGVAAQTESAAGAASR